MKRVILTIVLAVSVFISFQPMPMTAYAGYDEDTNKMVYDIWNYLVNSVNNGVNGVKAQVNNQDIEGKTSKGVEKFFNSKTTDENTSNILDDSFKFTEEQTEKGVTVKKEKKGLASLFISMANDQWKRVGKALEKGGDLSGTDSFNKNFSINSIKSSKVINIFKTFGYSLVLVFFSVTLIESTIKYEIFTIKGGAMIFGRLLISKVVIDSSVNICGYILTEVSKLLTSMSNSMKANEFMMIPDVQIVASAKSKLWILGPFVDLFISGIMMLPVIIIGLVAIICAGTIVIKLIFRSFELAMLMVVSPAFFACASADVTKPYFKNFIINFIRCAFQIIFMAVVWVVVVQWQINKTTFGTYADLGSYIWNMVPNLFTMIAMTIIMIKPPKVLTSLIR